MSSFDIKWMYLTLSGVIVTMFTREHITVGGLISQLVSSTKPSLVYFISDDLLGLSCQESVQLGGSVGLLYWRAAYETASNILVGIMGPCKKR